MSLFQRWRKRSSATTPGRPTRPDLAARRVQVDADADADVTLHTLVRAAPHMFVAHRAGPFARSPDLLELRLLDGAWVDYVTSTETVAPSAQAILYVHARWRGGRRWWMPRMWHAGTTELALLRNPSAGVVRVPATSVIFDGVEQTDPTCAILRLRVVK